MADEKTGGIAIVLVVEDEPLQRLDMIDMAEDAGFEVLEAHDADHAIALLERRADDLLAGVSESLPTLDWKEGPAS